MLAIQLTTSDEVCIAGSADLTSDAALHLLEKQLRSRSNIILNVAKLELADTTFLRFLIRLHGRVPGEKNVKLVGVGNHLQRVLEITGLSKLLNYEMK